ncbi:MAG: hypothetical protein IPL53_12745 [Ignavibacteria bacterium]|nr:hypothetical protein [Ignavibacteria bacterium]
MRSLKAQILQTNWAYNHTEFNSVTLPILSITPSLWNTGSLIKAIRDMESYVIRIMD